MSQHIFITFLGIGNPKSSPGELGYSILNYVFEDGFSSITAFAQRATVQWIGIEKIEKYLVLLTPESKEKHWEALKNEWTEIGVDLSRIQEITISTDQSKSAQWMWFQKLFSHVDVQDKLYFDFTHGFRSVPILFSTAIAFLQKSKEIQLKHAFYGYMEEDKVSGKIIDLVDFYRINDWADGVAALVESADPSKLNRLAEGEETNSPFQAINNPKLINALDELNQRIRSVDVEHVGESAQKVCHLIQQQRDPDSQTPDQFLLDMLSEKFIPLAVKTGLEYNKDYFLLQNTIIEVLVKHQFLMQAFTAMRELIGTLALPYLQNIPEISNNKKDKNLHRTYADVFFHMCQYNEKKWTFSQGQNEKTYKRFQILEEHCWNKISSEQKIELHTVAAQISTLRNGFDHAWLGRKGVPKDIHTQAVRLQEKLKETMLRMVKA